MRRCILVLAVAILAGCSRTEPEKAPTPAVQIAVPPNDKPVVNQGRHPKQKWAKELTDLDAKIADLKGDDKARKQELLAWLKTRPEYEDSGIAPIGNVWARFTDGRLVMVPFPAPQTRGSEPGPANPPAKNPPGKNGNFSVRFTIPASRQARLLEPFRGSLKSPIDGHLVPWLKGAGYAPSTGDASVDSLRTVKGDGIFYIDTHGLTGVERGDKQVFGMVSGVSVYPDDPAAQAIWEEDWKEGRLAYTAGQYGTNRYFVSHKFVKHYMSFADGAFVFINACSSEVEPTFRQAFFDKGAAVFAGWTASVMDPTANIVAKFYFDRLLGRNQFHCGDPFGLSKGPSIPLESPKQRPFDFASLFHDMQTRGFDADQFLAGGPPCHFRVHWSDKVIPPHTALCPSLISVYLIPHDTEEELALTGQFGQGTPQVTVGGVPVKFKRWEAKAKEDGMGMVVCSLPPGSAGDVVLTMDGRVSNPVPLTQWRVRFRFTQERINVTPPLKVTGTIDLHFRQDIHSFRVVPHEAVRTNSAQMLASLDSLVHWEFSGKGNFKDSPNVRVEWKGAGKMVRKEARTLGKDRPGVFDVIGHLDPQKKTFHVDSFHVMANKGGTETQTFDGQTRTSPCPFSVHVCDLKIALDDKFGILKGKHVWSDDYIKTTLEWDAAPATHGPTKETLSALPAPRTEHGLARLLPGRGCRKLF